MRKLTGKITIALIFLLLIGVILSACRSAEPEFDIDAQKTGFAQTAEVQATLTAAAQPTPTETPVPLPTFTPTPEATHTPVNTPTEVEDDDTPSAGGTDRAQLIAQVPGDNAIFQPGETFTVTWTFENTGSTTWTVNYYIEYAFGEDLGAQDKVFMWLPVPPETSLPIEVDLTAPESPGDKVSNWKLFNADEDAFYDFSITITVAE